MATAKEVFQQGVDSLARRDYHRAIALFSEAIRLDPNQPEFYHRRGDAYLEVGDFVNSCADFDQANQIRTS